MKWNKKLPKKAGYYWLLSEFFSVKRDSPVVVELMFLAGPTRPLVRYIGYGESSFDEHEIPKDAEWLGPIKIPKIN